MALLHDLGESVIGDLTPYDKVNFDKKQEMELNAFKQIFADFDNGKHYVDLFKEFKEGKTDEAKFVKKIDAIEMAFQAKIYGEQYDKNLQEFIDYTFSAVKDKHLTRVLSDFIKSF
jgi:5'-deoxynucleotidase YfbR-like HD superfamily hydrolase